MFEPKYSVYLDNIWFDSLYSVDYYNDKPNFFAHGAKQFFTIYQILRNGDFHLTMIEEASGEKFEFTKSSDFKIWVAKNYRFFRDHLDEIYWNRHPESKLQ